MRIGISTLLISAATLIALSIAGTRYYWPTSGKTITNTVTKEHTVTRIVKYPNGIVVTEIDAITNTNKVKASPKLSNWHASIAVVKSFDALSTTVYRLQVEKKIFGPIYVGAVLSTNSDVGLTIGLEF